MLTSIVDLQFGSTGKGLIAGYMSMKGKYDLVVSANMPNAGHTFVDRHGKKWINKVLPSGVYSPDLRYVCIGPGAIFDPARLVIEIEELRARAITAEVVIHPDAGLLMPGHKDAEKALVHIASTMQGSMEAQIHKMRRLTDGANTAGLNYAYLSQFTTAGNTTLWDYVVTHDEWREITLKSKNILMEGSQGYSLGINAGFYPYSTSRDCTVWRLIADCGVTVREALRVVGTCRVHPIRVGNIDGGNSGPGYSDQQETSWEALGVEPETTTVTGRVRRVFTWSTQQFLEAFVANRVDDVFLNFCNYDVPEAIYIRKMIDGTCGRIRAERSHVNSTYDFPTTVRYMGFGPGAESVMEIGEEVPC